MLEAGVVATDLPAQRCHGFLGDPRDPSSRKEQATDPPSNPWQEAHPCRSLDSDFSPPDLERINICCLKPPVLESSFMAALGK